MVNGRPRGATRVPAGKGHSAEGDLLSQPFWAEKSGTRLQQVKAAGRKCAASMECHPKLTRENEEGKNIYIKFMEEFLRVKAARTDIKTSWKFTREKIHLKKHNISWSLHLHCASTFLTLQAHITIFSELTLRHSQQNGPYLKFYIMWNEIFCWWWGWLEFLEVFLQ